MSVVAAQDPNIDALSRADVVLLAIKAMRATLQPMIANRECLIAWCDQLCHHT